MEMTPMSAASSEAPVSHGEPGIEEQPVDMGASDTLADFSDIESEPFGGESPTIDESHLPVEGHLSVWQQPFTQNVLPLMTSLVLHLGIFLVFLLTYKVVQVFHEKQVDQFIIPDSTITEGPEGGIPHPGLGGDPTRNGAQDQFPDISPDAKGVVANSNPSDLNKLLGGGDSGNEIASGVHLTPGQGLDQTPEGGGEGGASPFGIPGGGGGVGPPSSFVGTGGNARRIVYVLDATGSMLSEFDDLRAVLHQSIAGLRPPQAFNVVFIQENAPPPPAPDLLFVTPDNKKLVEDYVDKFTTRGPTDPLPALKTAFSMHPQLVYFLIDPSDFPDKKAVIDLVHQNAVSGKVKMNIIAFKGHDAENEKFLSELSKETGGVFKFMTRADLLKFESSE